MTEAPPVEARPVEAPTPASRPGRHEDQHPFVALTIVLIAAFMILLDISIVNVAIPSIQRDLHATYAQIQFVVAGYLLAYAVLLITGGRLGDIVGRKLMFIIGVSGFTVASVLCGLSQTGSQIVLARVFQGLMAAMMYPQIFSIITVVIPVQRRAAAFGIFGATVGLATVTGPLAGGLIIKANIAGLDWRPIFLINLPIGIAAVIAALVYLPESKSPDAPKLDIPGVLIASAGLFLLTFPLVEGRDAGWPLWTWAMLAGSVLMLVVFVVYERARERAGKDPLILLHLFKARSFSAGVVLFFVFFSGMPSLFLTLNLWLQIGLGFDAFRTGLTVIPFAIGSGVFSGLSARVIGRFGRHVLSVGAAVLVAGVLATIWTVNHYGTAIQGTDLIPALFISGVGLGLIISPSVNFILATVNPREAGSASGVITTVQQLGGAIGIAIIGVIFFGLLGSNAERIVQDQAAGMKQTMTSQGVPSAVADTVIGLYQTCAVDRARQSDPTATPESCARAQAYRPTAADLGLPSGPPPGTSAGPLTPQQQAAIAAAKAAAIQKGQQMANVIRSTVLDAADQFRAQDFTDTIQVSLLYNAGVFAVAFFLIFMLPRFIQAHGGPGGGAH